MFQERQRLLDPTAIRRRPEEAPARGFQAERDVGLDAQVRGQRQFLIDHGDAAASRVLRPGRFVGLAVQLENAGVRPDGPAQHLHQRRFAGPVFADQRVDLAGAQLQVHPGQRLRRTVALADVGHRQADGRVHGRFPVHDFFLNTGGVMVRFCCNSGTKSSRVFSSSRFSRVTTVSPVLRFRPPSDVS